MRPVSQPLGEVIGQPHSCILWGPPGVGKTTIARLLASAFAARFITISAVLGGVKEVREAVAQAQRAREGLEQRRTIVSVDEVRRLNNAVRSHINQKLRKAFVQFLVLPLCSMGVLHG